MNRLVDYDDSSPESDVSSNEDDMSLNGEEQIHRDIKATLNFLLFQVSKQSTEANDGALYTFDRKGYRDMIVRRVSLPSSSSGSDSDDSSILSSENDRSTVGHDDSEDSDCIFSRIVAASNKNKRQPVKLGRIPPKTKGEFSLQDLPPIENLRISVPETVQFTKLGVVSSIIDTLVVILSDQHVPALDQDTLVFTEDRQSLGKVFETFGPVIRPFYSIRFNTVTEIEDLNVKVGTSVYYLPEHEQYTHTVFTDALRLIKGSDASWEDNNEPPPDVVEFSDDEEERRWRARRRSKNGQNAADANTEVASVENAPAAKKRLKAKRRGSGGIAAPRRTASGTADFNNYAQFCPPSTSSSTSFVPRNNSPYSNPAVAPSFRPRNPWTGNRFTGYIPPPFHPNVPPPPPAVSNNANNWMWMSENEFRLPPPPLPFGFGRMRMSMPSQRQGFVRISNPYAPPPPTTSGPPPAPPALLLPMAPPPSSAGATMNLPPSFLMDNRYIQRND